MINREDMLELTRRMTPARSSVARIAGAYMDEEGYVDGTFNTNFLKLSAGERSKNLNLAKQVLLSRTNEQLKEFIREFCTKALTTLCVRSVCNPS